VFWCDWEDHPHREDIIATCRRAFVREYRALFREYRALFREYRALFREYRTFCRDNLIGNRAPSREFGSFGKT